MAVDDFFRLLLFFFEWFASHGPGSEYPQESPGNGKEGQETGILTTAELVQCNLSGQHLALHGSKSAVR